MPGVAKARCRPGGASVVTLPSGGWRSERVGERDPAQPPGVPPARIPPFSLVKTQELSSFQPLLLLLCFVAPPNTPARGRGDSVGCFCDQIHRWKNARTLVYGLSSREKCTWP